MVPLFNPALHESVFSQLQVPNIEYCDGILDDVLDTFIPFSAKNDLSDTDFTLVMIDDFIEVENII